jgi:MFS family permease
VKPPAIQLLANAGVFASIFFLPVFARDIGVNEFQLGVVVALFSVATLVSNYVFGRWADVHGRRRILQAGLLLSAAASITQVLANDVLTLAATRILVGLAVGVFPSAMYAYVYDSRQKIGKFASFGAIGWGVGSALAGYLALFWAIFLLSSVFLFMAFLIALFLTPIPEVKLKVPFFPKAVIKRNLSVYVAVLVRHTGAHAIWVIFPLFLLDLNMDLFAVGMLYAVNTGTQFVIMWGAADKFDSRKLISFGLLLSAITFVTFTFARNFNEMFPTQIILGVSWATMYVGSLKFVMERNVERATSTGLLNSVMSICAIIGPLIGGTTVGLALSLGVDQLSAYRWTMYVAAVMAIVSFIGFSISARKKKKSEDVELL